MSAAKVTKAAMFASGRAAAADWLSDNHKHEKPISLAKCRAVRLTDMVLQYEALPYFDALLTAWGEGFDSTVLANQRAHGGAGLGGSAPTAGARRLSAHTIAARAAEVVAESQHADILLRALLDKLGELGDVEALAAVDCFATCTARSVALMREAADSIAALVAEGGAA
jgi:hypothetical protein